MRHRKAFLFLALLTTLCGISCAESVVTFHNTVCIKPHKAYHYMTCNPVTVMIDHFIVVIPRNFDTDLASIPRWLWPILAPSRSDFIAPSILHDFLYTCHNGFERKEVDEIFYSALINNGVPTVRAYEMYIAVRLFGNNHFNNEGTCKERLLRLAKRYGKCRDMDSALS